MPFTDPDWFTTPIEYEIIDGECSYCGSDGEYFDPRLTEVIPNDDGSYPEGFWYCPHCEDYNLQIEQGTLEV